MDFYRFFTTASFRSPMVIKQIFKTWTITKKKKIHVYCYNIDVVFLVQNELVVFDFHSLNKYFSKIKLRPSTTKMRGKWLERTLYRLLCAKIKNILKAIRTIGPENPRYSTKTRRRRKSGVTLNYTVVIKVEFYF